MSPAGVEAVLGPDAAPTWVRAQAWVWVWVWARAHPLALAVASAAAVAIAVTAARAVALAVAGWRHRRLTRHAHLVHLTPPPIVEPAGAGVFWAGLAELLATARRRR